MDIWSPEKRSLVMSRVKSRGNKTTELALVSELKRFGIKGWRRHLTLRPDGLRITPDLVFNSFRLAVFIDGCFWHCCPKHGTIPSSNKSFWRRKLEVNVARDKRNKRILRKHGWKVVNVWEHQVRRDPVSCVVKILKSIV